MTLTPARIRIGRVRMKNGGADVRVLHQQRERSPVAEHLRQYVAGVLSGHDRPPDAYAAIAFWFNPATPGRPGYLANYSTAIDAMPAAVLVRMAAAHLIAEQAGHTAIDALDGELETWTPDDAS